MSKLLDVHRLAVALGLGLWGVDRVALQQTESVLPLHGGI